MIFSYRAAVKRTTVPVLTLELRLHLPGLRCKAPKNMALGVFDEQHGGAVVCQTRHHLGEALPMQVCGKHQPPGGAVAVR